MDQTCMARLFSCFYIGICVLAGTAPAAFCQTPSPTPPAGSQPAHRDGSAQMEKPAPLPPGAGADTPGGSAHDGVISPPAVNDTGIKRPVPGSGTTDNAVIPPSAASPAVPKP
jgi:hypothetical protein